MKINRRKFIAFAGASAAVLGMPNWSFAQSGVAFDKLNIFVPAAPGGGWDGLGRAIEAASKTAGLTNSIQVENVGGAGGMVGLPKFVNEKKGQGNTIMIGGSVMVGAGITNKSPVTIKDVIPIARLTEEAGAIVVPTSGKIKNWNDFITALKANPKAVSVAGGSAGGTDHQLLGLIIKALGGNAKDAAYVAFQGGGPANAAILGGQVSAGISGYSELEEHINSGKMKIIATSGNVRIPGVNAPTIKELGLNVVAANWRGVFAAPGVSAEQKNKIIDYITKLNASEPWKKTLVERKWTNVFLTGDAFQKALNEDIKNTEGVLKDLGLA
ncbi:MAG: Bug family tripartite tricarboxylate transporter substrate binding protein [Candidatus Fonsibacter sp.]